MAAHDRDRKQGGCRHNVFERCPANFTTEALSGPQAIPQVPTLSNSISEHPAPTRGIPHSGTQFHVDESVENVIDSPYESSQSLREQLSSIALSSVEARNLTLPR